MFDAATPAQPLLLIADGPVLIFGGAYSNLQATAALLEAARARHSARSDDLHR